MFVPCAFITGITGQFFRQFALTIASSTVISTFNSLTLSPALAAMLLKPKRKGSYQALPWPAFVVVWAAGWATRGSSPTARALGLEPAVIRRVAADVDDSSCGALGRPLVLGGLIGWLAIKPVNWVLGGFFALFNRGFDLAGRRYARLVGGMLRVTLLVLLVYGGMLCLTGYGYVGFPKGLLSDEFIAKLDKGKEHEKLALAEADRAVSRACPRASSRRRTWDTCWSTSSCPTRRRPSGRSTSCEECRTIALNTPGVGAHGRDLRPVDALERLRVELRLDVRHARRLRRAAQPTIERFFAWYAQTNSKTGGANGWAGRSRPGKPRAPTTWSVGAARRSHMKQALAEQRRDRRDAAQAVRGADSRGDDHGLPPPPVRGVGRAGGFMIMIEDRSSAAGSLEGLRTLQEVTEQPRRRGGIRDRPGDRRQEEAARVRDMSSVFRANVPQVFVDVNRSAAMLKGVPLQDVFQTLQIYLGSLYVNDFNLFGRTWQVIVQAEAKFRDQIDDIRRLKVRNIHGPDGPLGVGGRRPRGQRPAGA